MSTSHGQFYDVVQMLLVPSLLRGVSVGSQIDDVHHLWGFLFVLVCFVCVGFCLF